MPASVLMVGGNGDRTTGAVLPLALALAAAGHDCQRRSWTDRRGIDRWLMGHPAPRVVLAHSWGTPTVLRALRRTADRRPAVDWLITLDGVSVWSSGARPPGVERWTAVGVAWLWCWANLVAWAGRPMHRRIRGADQHLTALPPVTHADALGMVSALTRGPNGQHGTNA